MTFSYQVGILGRPNRDLAALSVAVRSALKELGADPKAVSFIPEKEIEDRDRKMPFVGVFFGYPGAKDVDHPILQDLIADSVVIIPVYREAGLFGANIPYCLHHINGLFVPKSTSSPKAPTRLVTLLFENFRLLRPERRLFISYRRVEAQGIAIQLYEHLDELGFDVFLDTHSMPPAVDFQGVLWHRLADSDVVVLLDTPGFRGSRWTREELARANATSIQILHLLWPGSDADGASAFSRFHILTTKDFTRGKEIGRSAKLKKTTASTVGTMTEALRARALSARHRYLVDNFCDQARALGQTPTVQATRFITLELSNGHNVAVVPAVGVPSAPRFQEIEAAISGFEMKFSAIWLLYDERGILDSWLGHVDWLNKHLPVSAVRVSESALRIREEAK